MISMSTLMAEVAPVARGFRHWIVHLGAVGFIPLGLLDGSVVPVPGSMDVLIIILSARRRDLWPLYTLMATIGSVVGLYITYHLAQKGGKEALAKRVRAHALQRVQNAFDRWGWGAIAVPAVLPPPVPMVPFVMAAGAMQYPVNKFLLALALGRVARYTILGFLAARYGRHILSFFRHLGRLGPFFIVGLIVAAVIGFLVFQAKRNKLPVAPAAGQD
jgi:membrane protein YqaA with SNARE-associated domain